MAETAAFFDLDHTVIWENSGHSSAQFALKYGFTTKSEVLRDSWNLVLYRMGLLDLDYWFCKSIERIRGVAEADMRRYGDQWFEELACHVVYREAAELIDAHRLQGHRTVMISNSPAFFVEAVARHLNIDDVICTRLEVEDGVYTGKVLRPLCYGAGKRDYAIAWARRNDVSLDDSWFYTDSRFDLDFCLAVGNPVATNPDLRLRWHALKNHWKIRDFKKEGRYVPPDNGGGRHVPPDIGGAEAPG